jgi:hypothetical protein
MSDDLYDDLDTTVREVIHELLKKIGEGCRSVGDHNNEYATLSREAIGFFGRRYGLSIKKKLKDTPHDWPNVTVLELAFAVGQVAGALWLFWRKTAPDVHPNVDIDLLMKAGHMLELECHDYLANTLAKGTLLTDQEWARGGYCT